MAENGIFLLISQCCKEQTNELHSYVRTQHIMTNERNELPHLHTIAAFISQTSVKTH
jgi:hypothetical protein